MSDGRRRRLELWLAMAVVAADQASKALVRSRIPELTAVTVVPGLLNLVHVQNTGAAFGVLEFVDFPFKSLVVSTVAVLALAAVGAYASSIARHQVVARTALALIIGGAAGNLVDRVALGSVVDFVDVYWRTWHFWAFNVADSSITVGVGIMILDMLGTGSHVSTAV